MQRKPLQMKWNPYKAPSAWSALHMLLYHFISLFDHGWPGPMGIMGIGQFQSDHVGYSPKQQLDFGFPICSKQVLGYGVSKWAKWGYRDPHGNPKSMRIKSCGTNVERPLVPLFHCCFHEENNAEFPADHTGEVMGNAPRNHFHGFLSTACWPPTQLIADHCSHIVAVRL